MPSYYPKKDYKLLGVVKSKRANKKYAAVLENKQTGREVKIHFGDSRYQQYEDLAEGDYSHLNHNDPKRLKQYLQRHKNDVNKPYSASWFSREYLWSTKSPPKYPGQKKRRSPSAGKRARRRSPSARKRARRRSPSARKKCQRSAESRLQKNNKQISSLRLKKLKCDDKSTAKDTGKCRRSFSKKIKTKNKYSIKLKSEWKKC